MRMLFIDTETTGLCTIRDRAFLVGFCAEEGPAEAVRLDEPGAAARVQAALDRSDRVVAHNASFDLHMLANAGVRVDPHRWDCTAVREALVSERFPSYKLDACAARRGLALKERVLGDVLWHVSHAEHFPPEQAAEYVRHDAETVRALWLDQQKSRTDIFRLEQRVVGVLWEMERHGIRVDRQLALQRSQQIKAEVARRTLALCRHFPRFDPLSGKAMERVLGVEKGPNGWHVAGTPIPATPGGKPSLSAEVLESLDHPIARETVELRKLHKLAHTFLDGHVLGRLEARDGGHFVRPRINQVTNGEAGTKTGRLSFSEPALQQIPSKRSGLAGMIRDAFLPDPGQVWAYGDFEQNEFRVFAHFSGAEVLFDAYRADPASDFHTLVATMLDIPRSAGPGGGANAKQLNLALLFAMGKAKLARTLGLPTRWVEQGLRRFETCGPETEEALAKYHAAIPGVNEAIQRYRNEAERRGMVMTPAGRRIHFESKEEAYKAAGLLYQATAADANKEGLLKCHAFAKDCGGRLVLNVHDEYSLSLPADQARRLPELERELSDAGFRVPLMIRFTTGDNWFAAINGEMPK